MQVDKLLAPQVPYQGIASPEQGKPGEAFYLDVNHPTDFGHEVRVGCRVSSVAGVLRSW